MPRNLYAIRIEADRWIAAAVLPAAAARVLDGGGSILLATPAELASAAQGQRKAVALIHRDTCGTRRRTGAAIAAPARREAA